MPAHNTSIQGLLVIRWPDCEDSRGFFRQSYQVREISEALGRNVFFAQGNHSRSHARVLRGFHAEPWDKCVYVARGTATCVVADIRPDSPTFGRTESFILGDPPGERIRLFVSKGLCNAVYCHTEVDYLNEVSEEFDSSHRGGIIWDDPDLAVAWPDSDPVLSTTDSALPTLRAYCAARSVANQTASR
jgi:dTDP-4-dehydrorhamnose 3,5-epimerase